VPIFNISPFLIFTSISYLLFLPFIVVAYYLWPARRTPPPTPLLGGEGRTPPPTPPRNREGSASTRIEGGNSFQWIWLALASVAWYLSFIPIFFALIGALAVGKYFTDKQAHKEKDMSIVMSAHLTLNT
jgi:hypothetical protein